MRSDFKKQRDEEMGHGMKLGFVTAILPDLPLDEVLEFAASE